MLNCNGRKNSASSFCCLFRRPVQNKSPFKKIQRQRLLKLHHRSTSHVTVRVRGTRYSIIRKWYTLRKLTCLRSCYWHQSSPTLDWVEVWTEIVSLMYPFFPPPCKRKKWSGYARLPLCFTTPTLHCPLHSTTPYPPPCGSAFDSGYISEKPSKMVGNSASYP